MSRTRSIVWKGLVAIVAFVALAQLVPYGHGRTNPPVISEPQWDSAATRDLARRACFDCHSNETVWPAYSRVAPISWLVVHDVDEGRGVLNFSEWQRPQEEAGEAFEVVREGEMPPGIYALMHAHARLDSSEREALARGLAASLGSSARRSREGSR